jgi:hypothetical protein
MARAALCITVELLRGAANEVRHRKLPHDGGLHPRGHADPAVVRRPGRATAPAPIASAIVQAVAECLAGVVYVNAMAPGHPAIFGTWPFVSDLRTGAMSGGSAEQALLSAGCAQMHKFYGIPGGAAGGMSDSKVPDMQAGWEQGDHQRAQRVVGAEHDLRIRGHVRLTHGVLAWRGWCWATT